MGGTSAELGTNIEVDATGVTPKARLYQKLQAILIIKTIYLCGLNYIRPISRYYFFCLKINRNEESFVK